MTGRLVVLGDSFLDVDVDGVADRLSPDGPVPVVEQRTIRRRPGGAGLAALLAARDGDPVLLVTALGDDRAGEQLRRLLEAEGVELVDVGSGTTPVKTRVRVGGSIVTRIDRVGGVEVVVAPPHGVVSAAGAVVVADYGLGLAAHGDLRAEVEAAEGTPVVWDPHPRGAEPTAGTWIATPNQREAEVFSGIEGRSLDAALEQAEQLARRWPVGAVSVTCGSEGSVLATADGRLPLVVPTSRVDGADACGAGDRFSSRMAQALAAGAVPSEAVVAATEAATDYVAAGGVSGLERPAIVTADPIAGVRRRGGRIVATGGCFDLLHPGHLLLLDRARSLGDCLVVCLNSDASVRALKGEGRPVHPVAERRMMLEHLRAVDAVLVFDEPTPEAALRRLRPDVFVKGGDYTQVTPGERRAVEAGGGRVVVLPYVGGHSTTRILEEVRHGG